MFHSRIVNNEINHRHEWCLASVTRGKSPSFEKLLERDKSVTMRNRNQQMLVTPMFKMYRNISPLIFSEIFHRLDINYNHGDMN